MDQVEEKFKEIDENFKKVDKRFNDVDENFKKVRCDILDQGDRLVPKNEFDAHINRFNSLEEKVKTKAK